MPSVARRVAGVRCSQSAGLMGSSLRWAQQRCSQATETRSLAPPPTKQRADSSSMLPASVCVTLP